MFDDRSLIVSAALKGDKVAQLWCMTPEGTQRVRLTQESRACQSPRWSADGKRISYGLATGKTNDAGDEILEWYECDEKGKGRKRSTPPIPKAESPAITPIETEDYVTGFRVGSAPPKTITLSSSAKKFFEDTGISGGILHLSALPNTSAFVLGVQLAGGNREGKWHTAVKVEVATGKAEPWGEYGFSGFSVSPDGKRFVTCFNRMVNGKQENAVYLGSMAQPRKLTRVLTSPELVSADWRGGTRVL
jgi:dipeptidyl aminopeptidase/acylaminoacyl peptidase